MRSYDHKKIEKKWQQKWAKVKQYKTPDSVKGKDNFLLLTEFPYPSGNLHVGHWYAFSIPDILARMMRMQGKNVMYPIGFDAFGLPAENAAIKNKLNPRKWTYGNIAYMKKQMAAMGASFDWSRQVITCDPNYYKWTQWQFIQFFKKGLAYKKETPVNWCPKDKTVLANEQVVNGKCERCDSEVIQRNMLQWNLKITDYAERLIDDLKDLDWPEQIKESQRNWIGRSEGAEIDFPLDVGVKYKFVILHGFEGTPDAPRYRFWKAELEKLGHEVIIPELPDTEQPSEQNQVQEALKATNYDKNTVLFGHSLGAVVAMKVLEQLRSPIARLVLAGGFVDRNFKDHPRNFDKRFEWKFDSEKIQKNVSSITILHDENDHAIGKEQVAHLEETLGAKAQILRAEKAHFTGEKERDILMWLRPTMRVFTTRADTLCGATYLVLAPEHPWVTLAIDDTHRMLTNKDEVRAYVHSASKKTELERLSDTKDKTGVELKGVKAINPATGAKMPVWVADFVLSHYGSGAVFADAHDERDFEFAKKFGIPLKTTIKPVGVDDSAIRNLEQCYSGKGILYDSGEFSGLTSDEAIPKIAQRFGTKKTTYKLRDWIVSRQRYWGVPIPIIHCKNCGDVAVPDKDLPVKLPEVKDYLPEGSGKSPLAKAKKWVQVKCPQCKEWAKRETDTLDTFVDSSWYFLRYTDPNNAAKFASLKSQEKWMPVNLYSGGAEHTTMHVLYSRFWQKALYDLGLVKDKEPYTRRMNRSVILGPDGQKMSKSRGNVIDPDEVVARLGADTVRMYLSFIGPYNEVSTYPWNPDGVVGVRRFLERVWKLQEKLSPKSNQATERALHQTIKKVTEDIAALKFNTAIASLMSFLNLVLQEGIGRLDYQTVLKLVAPLAPHITEELWSLAGNKRSIHLQKWPVYDADKLQADTVTIAVQINGKTRGTIVVALGSDESSVRSEAEKNPTVSKHLEGLVVKRVVYVKNRLLNFVS